MGGSQVVVVGAGFGGLQAARGLAGADVAVTIVDRNNFHSFLPLLYQVATAGLNSADIAPSIRGIFQRQDNVEFRQGEVVGVDWDTRTVSLADGSLPFDHLVIAAGSSANFFAIPGAAEHAMPLYALEDSVRLRNRVLAQFEAADQDQSLVDRGALSFVIVGAGPTGVETAGALAELFEKVLARDFHRLDVHRARVVLLEAGDTVLPPFAARSQRHAIAALRARGVDVRLGARVAAVHADAVELAGGERIPTRTLVWAAGVRANPLTRALGVDLDRAGRIVVDDRLRVPGRPAWAIGDIAHIESSGGPLPQLAPVAIQSGRHVAREIRAALDGTASTPFHYRDKGTMATIGRRSAVADIPRLPSLRGSLAWVAWLALHLYFLIGFRNRISVLVNWTWNYLTWDRGPRIIFGPGADDRPGVRTDDAVTPRSASGRPGTPAGAAGATRAVGACAGAQSTVASPAGRSDPDPWSVPACSSQVRNMSA